jgi:hypothetical protein
MQKIAYSAYLCISYYTSFCHFVLQAYPLLFTPGVKLHIQLVFHPALLRLISIVPVYFIIFAIIASENGEHIDSY